MTLYHVSLEKIDKLIPMVPLHRLDSEDKNIERICCSDSIEGAMAAMPDIVKVLKGQKILENSRHIPPLFYIYEIDECTISSKNILKPEKCASLYGVLDAEMTREYWILNSDVGATEKVMKLESYDIEHVEVHGYFYAYIDMPKHVKFSEASKEDRIQYERFWNFMKDELGKTEVYIG